MGVYALASQQCLGYNKTTDVLVLLRGRDADS